MHAQIDAFIKAANMGSKGLFGLASFRRKQPGTEAQITMDDLLIYTNVCPSAAW